MQNVSLGDNLHKLSKHIFRENKKKHHHFVICLINPDSGKGQQSLQEKKKKRVLFNRYGLFLLLAILSSEGKYDVLN